MKILVRVVRGPSTMAVHRSWSNPWATEMINLTWAQNGRFPMVGHYPSTAKPMQSVFFFGVLIGVCSCSIGRQSFFFAGKLLQFFTGGDFL